MTENSTNPQNDVVRSGMMKVLRNLWSNAWRVAAFANLQAIGTLLTGLAYHHSLFLAVALFVAGGVISFFGISILLGLVGCGWQPFFLPKTCMIVNLRVSS